MKATEISDIFGAYIDWSVWSRNKKFYKQISIRILEKKRGNHDVAHFGLPVYHNCVMLFAICEL